MKTNEGEIQRALDLIHPKWNVIELRAKSVDGGYLSGYFTNFQDLVDVAAGIGWNLQGSPCSPAVYWNINELDEGIAKFATNDINPATKGGCTSNDLIVRRTNLLFDFDPKRPSGSSSTDDQLQAAIEMAEAVRERTRSLGWPDPALIESGNGSYLNYRIDLVNDFESTNLIKAVIEAVGKEFDTDLVQVDRTVSNSGQIVRIPGTVNRKGEHSENTPHRMARIIEAPDQLEPVSVEQLTELAGDHLRPAKSAQKGKQLVGGSSDSCVKYYCDFLDEREVKYSIKESSDEDGTNFTMILLDRCPMRPDQDDGGTWLRIHPTQGTHGGCHHNKCQGKKLFDILKTIEPNYEEIVEASIAVPGTELDSITNPHRIAAGYLRQFEHPEFPTVCRVGKVLFTWKRDRWIELPDVDAHAGIARAAREKFLAHIEALQERGINKKTPHVTKKTQSDVHSVSLSLVKSAKGDAPCWHYGDGPDANNLIVFANGYLDVDEYLKGNRDALRPHTPRLFNLNCLPFDYQPDAAEPVEWKKFLASIWPDDTDSIRLLQQWFGYGLTSSTDQHKFLVLYGASRGGKGTTTRVLTAVVGQDNVAANDLDQLATQFGRENLVGKSHLIPPDAQRPKEVFAKKTTGIIKALSGGDDLFNIPRKNKPSLDTVLKIKITIPTNELMDLPDTSKALYNRMMLLRFEQSFLGKEDRELDNKLERELPGIANWALDGLIDLRQSGQFVEPDASVELKQSLLQTGSPVSAFSDECCIFELDAFVSADDLFGAYQKWCSGANGRSLERTEFRKAFLESNPQVKDVKRGSRGAQKRGFSNVKLVAHATPEEHPATVKFPS